jgi:glycosyltransferase involved in cell wall biosynthesis
MSYFYIMVPAYNAGRWIEECLESIEQQNYPKECMKVIMIDDCSEDDTWDKMQRFPFLKVRNKTHTGSVVRNMVAVTKLERPELEDIMMVIDGDDPGLKGNGVLSYLDSVYREYVWFTYGQYEPLSGTYKNFCKPILNSDIYRKNEEWTIGQLRTWKAWLWNLVQKDDMQRDGEYFKAAGDRSFSYTMIEMAGTHVRFIQRVLYIYNDLNPLNEFRLKPEEAEETAKYIISKKEYKRL